MAEGLSRAETVEAVRQGRKPGRRQGQGGQGRPKRPTVRTIKTTSARVTVEFSGPSSLAEVLAALREAPAKVEAEQGGESEAA